VSAPSRPREAAQAAEDIAGAHQELILSRLEMMRGYAETTGCRRQFRLGYFGENDAHPCANCDTCTATEQPTEAGGLRRNAEVEHAEWGHGVVMSGRGRPIDRPVRHRGLQDALPRGGRRRAVADRQLDRVNGRCARGTHGQ
jgi:hypothetical protein